MKIDWAKKLSSRKFWSLIASFVSSMIAFFGGSESVAVQVTSLIVLGGAIVAYILTEGKIDAAAAKKPDLVEPDADAYNDAKRG